MSLGYGKNFLGFDDTYFPVPFLNDLLDMFEAVFVGALADALAEVFVADACGPHIRPVGTAVGI